MVGTAGCEQNIPGLHLAVKLHPGAGRARWGLVVLLFNFSEDKCHEEYYKEELALVREDSLLKDEQELFRQSGLFLEKGTYTPSPQAPRQGMSTGQSKQPAKWWLLESWGEAAGRRGRGRTEPCAFSTI